MSKKTKFFDVECADDSAYDLKQLRRILGKVIGTRVKTLRVFRMGRLDSRVIRVVVEQDKYTKVDFKALQRDILNDKGVFLTEVAADGSGESLQIEPETIVPSAVSISVQLIKSDEPEKSVKPSRSRHPSSRPTRPRSTSAA